MPADTRTSIKKDALRRLGRRAMSCAKLRDALVKRWSEPDTVNEVVAELERAGLLNDRAFAQEAIRQELRKSPAANRALVRRLKLLGVEESIAREEVELATADRNVRAEAHDFAERRLRAMSPKLTDEAKARRLSAALARRGFDYDMIRELTSSLLNAAAHEEF